MPVQLNFQEPFIGQTFCVRVMFSGFMVDASNIFRFEGAGESNSSSEYSLEWGIFKPAADKRQVNFGEPSTKKLLNFGHCPKLL